MIARNSTFVYKGRAVDVKQIGRDLGVRYILEGSVRKLGNRVRITSQLIEAANATHVWAERYDRALDDIFALQDELTISVVGAIEPTLRQAEVERARRKRPDSLDAYDLYLRALPNTFIAMPDTADEALDLLQQAIAIEPNYAAAHAAIAFCHEVRYIRGGLLEEDKRTALRHARIAVATGSDDATALAGAAFVIGILERDYDNAFDAFDRALALSPSSALALCFSAIVRAWAVILRPQSNRRSNRYASARPVPCYSCPISAWHMRIFSPAASMRPRSRRAATRRPTCSSAFPGCCAPPRLPISAGASEPKPARSGSGNYGPVSR